MTTLAYSHTLVAGTPENINDVQDMFNDARTVINGNLDATNLATSAKPVTSLAPYKTISNSSVVFVNSHSATTYYGTSGGSAAASGVASGASPALAIVNTADFSVAPLTTQFRIQAGMVTNGVAPAVDFAYTLRPIGSLAGTGGSLTISLGSTVSGSLVTRTAPALGTSFTDSSADFTISTSGVYLLACSLSGVPAAGSFTAITWALQVHHI